MKHMTINNRKVSFDKETNVLSVIRKSGIELPTFCYHSELSTYGACRMCVVENDKGQVFASCSEVPRDGMVIYTNTPRLQHHRKMIIEMLLASHERECTTCHNSGDCALQQLAEQLGVSMIRFDNPKPLVPIDESSDSIVIDENKCILCGDCVRTCEEIQGVGVLEFAYRGSNMRVTPAFGRIMKETDCVGCGQCRVSCPTGAITIKQNIRPVWEALADKNVRVVAQIAPAVRVAIGDKFGFKKGENALGHLAAALRRMGFDEVYDTDFGADLTVIEEAEELLHYLKKDHDLPMFTSCCPAWVKFCEQRHPDLVPHISSCRSPMQMFGAVLKADAKRRKDDDRRTMVVAIMPCTAKKGEILRPDSKTDGEQDVDYVLTTTEISRMIKEGGMDLSRLPAESLDMPFGLASGAGAIFGASGGVTEAVIRNIVGSSDMDVLDSIGFMGMRGDGGIKEFEIEVEGKPVRIAIVNGLKNADDLIKRIKAGEASYDFVEVMACRRGCIAGGGQPVPMNRYVRKDRYEGIYAVDADSQIKVSSANPIAVHIYDDILKNQEHKLLHVPKGTRNVPKAKNSCGCGEK